MSTHRQMQEDDRTLLGKLLRRARGGDVDILNFLANVYTRGAAELQKNLPRARTFARRAARLGHVDAQATLATMLNNEGEMAESFHWFSQAAAGGSCRAQMSLYEHYMAGVVVDADIDQALYWLDMAAENNPPPRVLDEVAYLESIVFVHVEFSCGKDLVSRLVPMRRRTFWRMDAYQVPLFDDMLADLNAFVEREPVISTEYLEAMRWLKKQKVIWSLSPAVELVGVREKGSESQNG